MFNNSKNSNHSNRSSERSMKRESTQRGPSTNRSRSARSIPSVRQSDANPTQWRIPLWVHCEKCFVTHEFDPNMNLLSCGHIFCRTCLRSDDSLLTNGTVPCLQCKTAVEHRALNSSLDGKLHGMFQQNWVDPVLQINLTNMRFMMTKTQNYSNFLAKSIKQGPNMPSEWINRYNGIKKAQERIQKLQNFENELNTKTEVIKNEAFKKYKKIQMLRALYQRKKAEPVKQQQQRKQQQQQQRPPQQHQQQRQQSQQRHRGQGNYDNNMKFVSSGRNEQSNQYIGQLKAPHRPVNQNQSAPNIRNQKIVTPAPRHNQSVNPSYRDGSSKQSASSRPDIQSATFRPKPNDFSSENRRHQPQSQAQKRLVPSYDRDKYTTPSKRAAFHPSQREINLDTSISSVGSSTIINQLGKYP